MSKGADLIAAERARQVTEEGWTAEHDEGHAAQLLAAASAYIADADFRARHPEAPPSPYPVDEDTGAIYFPWAPAYWKPSMDPVRTLTKAGALIAAAIDDLTRTAGVRMSADPMPTIKDILGWPAETRPVPVPALLDALHEYQAEEGITAESMLTVAIEALVQTVTALVEQQRIGNIIAWEQVTGEKNRALIRDGLGLQ